MQLLKMRTGFAILFQPVRNNSRAFDKNFIFEDQAVISAGPSSQNRIPGNSFF